MPLLKDMFPSTYLSGDDLEGKSYVMTISHVKEEEMFDKQTQQKVPKWVLYFKEAKKGVLLGSEVSDDIAEILGDTVGKTENWIGKQVEIFPKIITAFGKKHNVVRYRKPTQKPKTEKPPEPPKSTQVKEEPKVVEAVTLQPGVAPPSTNPEVPLYDILESEMIQIEHDDDPIEFIAFMQDKYPKFAQINETQRAKLEKTFQRLKVLFKQ